MGLESGKTRVAAAVRRFRPPDTDAVMAIVGESPQAANWSRESYAKFAKESGSIVLVIESDRQVSGFLVGRIAGDQAEVLNLAVRAKQRRRGAGTALLAAALKELGSMGANSVYLEVRESNTAAIAFYERHGFAKTGRRKGYYRDPDEAAVTMQKKLGD